jgi:hypothetical protein
MSSSLSWRGSEVKRWQALVAALALAASRVGGLVSSGSGYRSDEPKFYEPDPFATEAPFLSPSWPRGNRDQRSL